MSARAADSPRVLVLSLRAHHPAVSRCGTFEFEDVACEVDAVELRPYGDRKVAFPYVVARLEARVPRLWSALSGPPRELRGKYDLLYVSVHSPLELDWMQPLARYLDLAKRTVCMVDELWVSNLLHRTGELSILRRFDHLYTYCAGAVETLGRATGRAAHYMPPSVDALRFCPPDGDYPRSIDVYLMGRRRQQMHDALRTVTRATQRFYLFDSSGHSAPYSYVEHRERLAELIGRTKYFVVDVAKADWAHEIGSQEEVGTRFFEAAGAGAVLVGRAPRSASFAQSFGWPDSVVPMADDPESVAAVLGELDSNPERVAKIRRENVLNSLRRHDSVYRWEMILRDVGLEPGAGIEARKRRLEARAKEIESA